MTNSQVRAIKRGDRVQDQAGREWTARHDAFTPARDTVNAQVAVTRQQAGSTWVRTLTCKSEDF